MNLTCIYFIVLDLVLNGTLVATYVQFPDPPILHNYTYAIYFYAKKNSIKALIHSQLVPVIKFGLCLKPLHAYCPFLHSLLSSLFQLSLLNYNPLLYLILGEEKNKE